MRFIRCSLTRAAVIILYIIWPLFLPVVCQGDIDARALPRDGSTFAPAALTPSDSRYNTHLHDVLCHVSGKCLVVGTHGAIFSTADSGVSWVQRISGTADELRAIGCLFEDGRLLCLTGGRRAIKTSLSLLITFDSGESWEDVGNQVFSDSDDGDNQVNTITCSGTACFIAGRLGSVLECQMQGSWTTTTCRKIYLSQGRIAMNHVSASAAHGTAGKATLLFATTEGALLHFDASTRKLHKGVVLPFMGESFNIWDMSILKGTGVGYACGNELFKTEDSGSTWMRLNFLESPFASICYSVLVLSEDVVYAMSEDAIHLSEDGGSSWETVLSTPSCNSFGTQGADAGWGKLDGYVDSTPFVATTARPCAMEAGLRPSGISLGGSLTWENLPTDNTGKAPGNPREVKFRVQLSYQCGTGFQLACPQVGMQISSSQATLLFGDGDFTTLSTMTVTYVLSEAYYTAEKQIVYNYDPPQPSGKRRSLQQTQSDLTFNAILMGDQLVDVANRESGAFPNLVLRAQVKVSTAQEPDSAPAGSMAPLLRFYNGDLLLSTDVTGSISAIYLDPAFYIPAGDAEFDKIIFEFASDDDILLTSGTQPYTYPYGATLDSNGLFTWDLTMTNLIMPSLNCTTYFHVNVLLKNSAGDVASSVAFTLALQSYANAAGEMLYRDAETATFNQQETSPALTGILP
ncbi:hypothetical protein CYMTET_50305 [Cymbomonas tetramitiformis]|uniref:Photosynthesis system II assembly factor Ycf48/Hcf136-like domain-containing protein n=1 Tax=Cymbomonas tetramitiformis TaxID=36881 RepID=A0AAE0BPJ1_9CHLO|nr:hypothetical protein CYMTET_50305 [Cymbomonas tetramitiformis]